MHAPRGSGPRRVGGAPDAATLALRRRMLFYPVAAATISVIVMVATVAVDAAAAGSGLSEVERVAQVHQLRDTIHKLPAAEAARRFAKLTVRGAPPPRQQEIDHFVVLYMENQPFTRFFGCMDLPGADGISKDGMYLPKNPKNHSAGFLNISCDTADYICKQGPKYAFMDAFFEPGANASTYPYPSQSVENAGLQLNDPSSLEFFAPDKVPIKQALAKSYGVFNKMFTASPTMSWPNHMLTQSGTSCGLTSTGHTFDQGGGPTKTYPQFTIYDSMALDNVSFGIYINVTCGIGQEPPCTDDPPGELIDWHMAGVARHVDKFDSHTTFYEQAAEGQLPAFSWISPNIEACDHPCHDIAKGERQLKDVYEALRAGPKWEKTLFLVAYDDIGGYFDTVVPPSEGVPAPDAPCDEYNDGFPTKFDFRRLGGRSASLLMGAKVPNAVFQEPKRGPTSTSQFDLTSVASTLDVLFNLSTPLTRRTMWSGRFDELLLPHPRPEAEMPLHLPDAPAAAEEWSCETPHDASSARRALQQTQQHEESVGSKLNRPQHCGATEQACRARDRLSTKQERLMATFSELSGELLPSNAKSMSPNAAGQWLARAWETWRKSGHSLR